MSEPAPKVELLTLCDGVHRCPITSKTYLMGITRLAIVPRVPVTFDALILFCQASKLAGDVAVKWDMAMPDGAMAQGIGGEFVLRPRVGLSVGEGATILRELVLPRAGDYRFRVRHRGIAIAEHVLGIVVAKADTQG